jgi:hypothetical protein
MACRPYYVEILLRRCAMYKEFQPSEKVVAIAKFDGNLVVATERAIYKYNKGKDCIDPVPISQDTREADLSMRADEFWHEIKRQLRDIPKDSDVIVNIEVKDKKSQ